MIIHPKAREIVGQSPNGSCPFCLRELIKYNPSGSNDVDPDDDMMSLVCNKREGGGWCKRRFELNWENRQLPFDERVFSIVSFRVLDETYYISLYFQKHEMRVSDHGGSFIFKSQIPNFVWDDESIKSKIKTLIPFS